MTVSSFCESRNGPYTNFRHAIDFEAKKDPSSRKRAKR
jgi:hypothetical protein